MVRGGEEKMPVSREPVQNRCAVSFDETHAAFPAAYLDTLAYSLTHGKALWSLEVLLENVQRQLRVSVSSSPRPRHLGIRWYAPTAAPRDAHL